MDALITIQGIKIQLLVFNKGIMPYWFCRIGLFNSKYYNNKLAKYIQTIYRRTING